MIYVFNEIGHKITFFKYHKYIPSAYSASLARAILEKKKKTNRIYYLLSLPNTKVKRNENSLVFVKIKLIHEHLMYAVMTKFIAVIQID